VNNLIVTNGNAGESVGGGLRNLGTVTLNGDSFVANVAYYGGGIENEGTLTLLNSTVSGNQAAAFILNEGGGIYSSGAITIMNSTISGNTANPSPSWTAAGGGIFIYQGSLTMVGVTVSGNSTTQGNVGAGLYVLSGSVSIVNSVFSGNLDYFDPPAIFGETDCVSNGQPCPVNGVGGNIVGTAAALNLAPLANYGGKTQTMLPLPGSPAICAGILADSQAASLGSDQRGAGFDPNCPAGSGLFDSGAVQSNYSLSFSTSPGSLQFTGVALTPSPVVALTEIGGVVPAAATGTVTVTDSSTYLSGTETAPLSGGAATFNALTVSQPFTGDTLTASLPLTATVNVLSPASNSFNVVNPPVATTFVLGSVPSSVYVGAAFNFTLTVNDQYGNLFPGCTGTVTISSTDTAASFNPAVYTFTGASGDAGSHSFSATLNTPGSQTITATDTSNGALTVTSGGINATIPDLVVTTAGDDAGTASNCTVQSTPGTGTEASCSLRDALLFAASAGSGNITFDSTVFASAQTITLTNGTLNIPSNTSITGATSGGGSSLTNLVTVNGNAASTVFTVNFSAFGASLSSLIITNGSNSYGGGISNSGGLAVIGSTISGNTAALGGAGIYNNAGSVNLYGDTLSGNSVTNSFSGGASGGGILNTSGSLSVLNCTLTANTAISGADGVGGAISSLSGTLVVVASSTISGNSSDGGGGGVFFSGGFLNLMGYNILSGNTSPSSPGPNIYGPYTEGGGDLIDVSNIGLAPLGNYGGPTQTMLPLPGSPAICGTQTGDGTLILNLAADQRGDPMDPVCPYLFVDSGAVQTNYTLAITTEPPSSAIVGVALTPAPVVTVYESGSVFAAVTGAVAITDGEGALTGNTSAALSSGSATFSNLIFSTFETSDTLTATLALNPSLAPPLNLTAKTTPVSAVETQSINFTPITGPQYALKQQPLSATASSSLPVTFSSITPSVCSVSGSALSLLISGTCVVHASQAGGAVYAAAPPAAQSFGVNGAAQTITFTPVSGTQYASTQLTLSATASSSLPVSFSSSTPTVCSVSGNTLSLLNAGTCVVHAAQAGNSVYGSATTAQSFAVKAAH
jgi:ribosomal protein S11